MEDCSHIKYETDNLHNSSRREIVVTIQNKFLFQKKKQQILEKVLGTVINLLTSNYCKCPFFLFVFNCSFTWAINLQIGNKGYCIFDLC